MFFVARSFLNIVISKVIRLGHTERNSLFKLIADNLMNKILMQKRIRMSIAGGGFYCFITSLTDSKTTLKRFSYLSILPAYIIKHTRSKFFIFSLIDSDFFVNIPSRRPYFDNNSLNKS